MTWLPVALAALVLGACGGSAEEDYKDDYPPVNQRLVSLGQEVGRAIQGAGQSSDRQLADRFGDYAQRLGELQQQLDELEPPEELTEEQDQLVSAIGDVQGSLEQIASAAEQGDADAAGQATVGLIESSRALRDARRELSSAVREL